MATDAVKEEYRSLQEEIDQYKKLISQQKNHLITLDREVNRTEGRIQVTLTVPGGIFKQQGKHSRHMKNIRVLENKLNQETIKFDDLLCSNMTYRKDIAHLLQQKGLGLNIKTKYHRQLASQKHIMEKLEERCTQALQHRSEAETRILEAKECIEGETAVFTKRQMQLKTIIYRDAKLNYFMGTKLQENSPLEDNEDSKKKKQEQQYQHGVDKLEMYKKGHRTLVEVTRERDLRLIGHMFIKNEQKNFAHIDYINELQSRRNMLKNGSLKLKSEILSLEQEDKGHQEKSKSQFEDVESELEKYSSLAAYLEEQCTAVQGTLYQLKTAINDLSEQALQESVTVTFDNIAQFTSLLEEIVSNLLIQANTMEDEQMQLTLNLANSDLLPECEAVVEVERGRTPSRSVKSACSDKKQ